MQETGPGIERCHSWPAGSDHASDRAREEVDTFRKQAFAVNCRPFREHDEALSGLGRELHRTEVVQERRSVGSAALVQHLCGLIGATAEPSEVTVSDRRGRMSAQESGTEDRIGGVPFRYGCFSKSHGVAAVAREGRNVAEHSDRVGCTVTRI
jgi:hypothetical protein